MFKPILVFLAFIVLVGPTTCRKRHVINFRWHNLYPESFIWDPKSEHFVVGSLRQQTLISVFDAGVTSSLLSDASLPSNSSFLGLALDLRHHRLLAVVHRPSTLTTPAFNALASYHLSTFDQLFLTPLPPPPFPSPPSQMTSQLTSLETLTSPTRPMTPSTKSTLKGRPQFYQNPKPSNPIPWKFGDSLRRFWGG
ncbi:NHL domain-containing protein [Abeliophyllum distichum]|uniref:NHL domain-containing protein n=1 Tax=Abeliophyllum distichum TaxID=126358 RepID=A0ABD1STP9_9LAMI